MAWATVTKGINQRWLSQGPIRTSPNPPYQVRLSPLGWATSLAWKDHSVHLWGRHQLEISIRFPGDETQSIHFKLGHRQPRATKVRKSQLSQGSPHLRRKMTTWKIWISSSWTSKVRQLSLKIRGWLKPSAQSTSSLNPRRRLTTSPGRIWARKQEPKAGRLENQM